MPSNIGLAYAQLKLRDYKLLESVHSPIHSAYSGQPSQAQAVTNKRRQQRACFQAFTFELGALNRQNTNSDIRIEISLMQRLSACVHGHDCHQ